MRLAQPALRAPQLRAGETKPLNTKQTFFRIRGCSGCVRWLSQFLGIVQNKAKHYDQCVFLLGGGWDDKFASSCSFSGSYFAVGYVHTLFIIITALMNFL